MKKFFAIFFFLIIVGAVGCGVYAIFYSYEFPGIVLTKWLTKFHPEIELKTFEYKRRQLDPWNLIIFEKVKLSFVKGWQTHHYDIGSVIIKSDKAFWDQDKKLTIMAEDVNCAIDQLSVKGLKINLFVNLDNTQVSHIEGSLKIGSLTSGVAHVEEIISLIQGDANQIKLNGLFAKGYGGEISGDVVFKNFQRLSYDFNLVLSAIDSKALQEINDSIFSKVNGKLQGKLRVSGQLSKIDALNCDLSLDSGGKISASLLSLIANYIPASAQKNEIDQLITTGGEIALEKGAVTLKSVSDDSLSAKINLQSRKLNVAINVTADIHLDVPLIKLLEKYTQQGHNM